MTYSGHQIPQLCQTNTHFCIYQTKRILINVQKKYKSIIKKYKMSQCARKKYMQYIKLQDDTIQ